MLAQPDRLSVRPRAAAGVHRPWHSNVGHAARRDGHSRSQNLLEPFREGDPRPVAPRRALMR